MDTSIVASAPVRFLVAGIGDALSTWFEARSNLESRTNNYVAGGFPPTATGIAIARACHDVLMRDGLKAKQAVEAVSLPRQSKTSSKLIRCSAVSASRTADAPQHTACMVD
ncbi:iron-containing alcohol dehydrogenase [Paraburkholderia sp. EG287B]|uniref:iron-containing alcohol dehydrogenase n=1 Tax=unclassified Paraburkholderia TaxID=2615204 RepID=UPI0034D36838